MNVDSLILGGGVAGLTAARALRGLGHTTLLLEKSQELGGMARRWACKADDSCLHCWACTADRAVKHGEELDWNGGVTDLEVSSGESGYRVQYRVESEVREVQAATLLVAIGFTPYRPAGPEANRFGYGTFANVMTGEELEETLRNDGRLESRGVGAVSRVAFIQCQGSRNARLGRGYCSRICCAYALRSAMALKYRDPSLTVSFFYMDVQLLGKDTERHLTRSREAVRMIRGLPGEVFEEPDHRISLSYDHEGATVTELFDRVVLSVGMAPAEDAGELAEKLGLARTGDGFLLPPDPPDRLFLAGACTGPMNIAQSTMQAEGAAWSAHLRLSGG